MTGVGWRLLGAGALGALVSSACFFGGAAAPTPGPTSGPTAAAAAVSPVPTKPAAVASPSPVAKPTATTATAAAIEKVWVGNTDGEGVFVRKTPVMAVRVRAYPDKSLLTIVGEDVDGDGQKWHHVRTPDGVDGYVPVQYTVTTEP
jgi:hypothetical protein